MLILLLTNTGVGPSHFLICDEQAKTNGTLTMYKPNGIDICWRTKHGVFVGDILSSSSPIPQSRVLSKQGLPPISSVCSKMNISLSGSGGWWNRNSPPTRTEDNQGIARDKPWLWLLPGRLLNQVMLPAAFGVYSTHIKIWEKKRRKQGQKKCDRKIIIHPKMGLEFMKINLNKIRNVSPKVTRHWQLYYNSIHYSNLSVSVGDWL